MAKVAKKKSEVYKFFIILGIFIAYMVFSVLHFGLSSGILVAVLSWSFFVFCTPIADAGFLLDFPIRLLTGIRMLYTELMVWAFAIAVNLLAVLINPEVYEKTALLHLFKQIITTPWPLGLIVLLSAVGTYISVYLGDDAFDIASSKNKKKKLKGERHKVIYSIVAFVVTIILYVALLKYTHIQIKIG